MLFTLSCLVNKSYFIESIFQLRFRQLGQRKKLSSMSLFRHIFFHKTVVSTLDVFTFLCRRCPTPKPPKHLLGSAELSKPHKRVGDGNLKKVKGIKKPCCLNPVKRVVLSLNRGCDSRRKSRDDDKCMASPLNYTYSMAWLIT